jgi:hypothetical protein
VQTLLAPAAIVPGVHTRLARAAAAG